MLVSISFQFVGFLLTYLLHTSHAARLGSRAGLGVTLIQYGFALRGKLDGMDGSDSQGTWGDWRTDTPADPTATLGSTTRPASWSDPIAGLGNATATAIPSPDDQLTQAILADATAEWLSFFLMTIGALLSHLCVVILLTCTVRLVCLTDVRSWLLPGQEVGEIDSGHSTAGVVSSRHSRPYDRRLRGRFCHPRHVSHRPSAQWIWTQPKAPGTGKQ
jgi:hypothetical protein